LRTECRLGLKSNKQYKQNDVAEDLAIERAKSLKSNKQYKQNLIKQYGRK